MIKNITLLFRFFSYYPLFIIILTFMMLAVIGLELLAMLSLAPMIDILIQTDPSQFSGITKRIMRLFSFLQIPFSLPFILTLFISCHFLKVVFATLQLKTSHHINFLVTKDLIYRAFSAIFNASWSFFSTKKGGDFFSLLQTQINNVGSIVVSLSQFMSSCLQIIFYLYIPFHLSWKVSCLVIVTGSLSFSLLKLVSKQVKRLSIQSITHNENYLSFLNECLNSIKLIFSFTKQQPSIKKLLALFSQNYHISVRIQLLQAIAQQCYQPIGFLMVAIALLYAQHLGLMMSNLTVLLYALVRIVPQLSQLAGLTLGLEQQLPYLQSIDTICEDALKAKQPTGTAPFTAFKHQISLQNISFSYEQSTPLIKNVSLNIPKNTMTALVGKSGGGKSTLADIISGFHRADSGAIFIDDTPLDSIDIYQYRSRIGYVMQDSPLFNMSVRDNLYWANPSATNTDMINACGQANALEFIEALPHGFDTLLGERGVRLSGGQCQRIALARALIIQPQLLILDEATSALDSHAESEIQKSIHSLSGKMTILVIAHRLSTIKKAEHIHVVDDGVVVESGAYDELMKMNQAFFEMVGKQAF